MRSFDLMGFSVNTTADKLLSLMEQKLIKKSKQVLQPPDERHQVYFIDDLNMSKTDKWLNQGANELIR